MLGHQSHTHEHIPQEVKFSRLERENARISFMYSAYNKCAIMDNQNGLYLWGIDFEGFKRAKPFLWH